MGKKDREQSKTNTKELASDAKSEYDVTQAGNDTRLNTLNTANLADKDKLSQLYSNLAQPGSSSGGGGHVDTGRLVGVYDDAMEFGKTGGFSPEREASIMGNVAGLKKLGETGGMTDEDANRFRANGTYEEFNKTGGYTDEDKSRIRQVALAPISGYASQTQDELNRRQAVQGGYGPGFDSAARALRRDAGKGMYEAGLNSEMAVKNAVNEGRQWGAKGMTDSENTYQTLKTGNQYKGLMGAADVETTLQDTISKYRMSGMTLAQASAKAIADVDQGNIENDQWSKTNGQNMQLAGLQGLQGLYNTGNQNEQHGYDLQSGLLGDEYQTRTGINSQLNELLQKPGFLEQLALAGVGGFAGAAGGALTGGIGPALGAAGKMGQNLSGGQANPALNKPRGY
jgi:hypothetical protein